MVAALAFVPSLIVIGAVLKQSKNISALAQLGRCVAVGAGVRMGRRRRSIRASTGAWGVGARLCPVRSFCFPAAFICVCVCMHSVAGRSVELEGVVREDVARKKAIDAEAEKIQDIDKMTFTLSAFNIGMTCFWFGRWPETFYLWHIPKVFVLTAVRWYLFKGEGKHYLLYDFCYWANGLSVFYTLFRPIDPICFQVLFLVANGPLAWSILAFSQSLVLHSMQHMISVFIHTSPMILTMALRWHKPCDGATSRFATVPPPDVSASVPSMVYRGVAYFYLPWVVLYYLWVFVLMGEHVKRKGYSTLFDRITGMALGKKLASIRDQTHLELVRKAVYLLCHLGFGTLTMSFAALFYHNEAAHFTFCLSILRFVLTGMSVFAILRACAILQLKMTVCLCSASAWNGASFYSKVWAQKYMGQVEQAAQKRIASVTQACTAPPASHATPQSKTDESAHALQSDWQSSRGVTVKAAEWLGLLLLSCLFYFLMVAGAGGGNARPVVVPEVRKGWLSVLGNFGRGGRKED